MGIEEVSNELVFDKPVFNGPITETPNVGGNYFVIPPGIVGNDKVTEMKQLRKQLKQDTP